MPRRVASEDMASPERPEPLQPPPVDSARVIGIGTAIWFVAFVALLPWWNWLDQHDHQVWLWTCLAGWLLGLAGLVVLARHKRAGRIV